MQATSHGGLLFHARVVEIAKCEREDKMHDMCKVQYLGFCSGANWRAFRCPLFGDTELRDPRQL